jgi:hypothetical protein
LGPIFIGLAAANDPAVPATQIETEGVKIPLSGESKPASINTGFNSAARQSAERTLISNNQHPSHYHMPRKSSFRQVLMS